MDVAIEENDERPGNRKAAKTSSVDVNRAPLQHLNTAARALAAKAAGADRSDLRHWRTTDDDLGVG
jgi:hypothetical protein